MDSGNGPPRRGARVAAGAGYDAHAAARRVAEPDKPAPGPPHGARGRFLRGPFVRDRARVLHCAAFRRLAAKTQVHTAGEDDFPRTRLTHSLEVAQIAREIGARLGCDADVVDTAGLAHDLGHPPFGHNGEDVLHELAEACGGFEGNAQTLRVLTRLEAKVDDAAGVSAGLNLTRAVLDAACKYPWPRRHGQRKFGVYPDDAPIFAWLRDGAPGQRRCLEAQVMDWADDVAYSVHDVEDGVHAGHIEFARLAGAEERAALAAQAAELYSDEPPDYLAAVLDDLLAEPLLASLAGYDGSHAAQVALKRAASVLIGRFVSVVVHATRQRQGDGPLARYAADLAVPREARARCALLKAVAYRHVMLRRGAEPRHTRQQELLRDLAHQLTLRAPDALDPGFRQMWLDAPDDAARLRVVIDQVASLTDASAVTWQRRLSGTG